MFIQKHSTTTYLLLLLLLVSLILDTFFLNIYRLNCSRYSVRVNAVIRGTDYFL